MSSPNFDEESAKVVLASNIDRMIEVREMTQQEAADLLGISQSKIKVLRNIQLEDFTLDRLFSLLKKLDPNIEKHLLEEYRDQGLCWRHDDEMFSKLTNVLLPLSIAALTLPYLKNGTPKLLCVVGGVMLMTFWFLSSQSYENRFHIRFSRIHEIERILGLDSHLRIKRERANNVLKGEHLRFWMFELYLLITVVIMLDIKMGATYGVEQFIRVFSDTKAATLQVWTIDVLTTDVWLIKLIELVVHLIIVVIVGLLGWIYRKRTRRILETTHKT